TNWLSATSTPVTVPPTRAATAFTWLSICASSVETRGRKGFEGRNNPKSAPSPKAPANWTRLFVISGSSFQELPVLGLGHPEGSGQLGLRDVVLEEARDAVFGCAGQGLLGLGDVDVA